jgi:plastocyanin
MNGLIRQVPILGLALLAGLFGAGCSVQSGRTEDVHNSETHAPPVAGKPAVSRASDAAPATPASPTAKPEVSIDNFTYNPQALTVSAGTKVTWINRDDLPHTVTSSVKPRLLDSPSLDTDESFAHVFNTPGTYEYYCTVHPKMTGKIIVK